MLKPGSLVTMTQRNRRSETLTEIEEYDAIVLDHVGAPGLNTFVVAYRDDEFPHDPVLERWNTTIILGEDLKERSA